MIRNALSKRHRTLLRLKAQHHWCLTGTLIFNQAEDLGALVRFLRIHPFDNTQYFNSYITQKLKKDDKNGLENLKRLFHGVALRRTKDVVLDDLGLPPRESRTQEVEFTPQERELYAVLRKSIFICFQAPEPGSDQKRLSNGLLPTIHRLRRFYNHGPDLMPSQVQSLLEEPASEKEIANVITAGLDTCDDCDVQISMKNHRKIAVRTFQCGHTICHECVAPPPVDSQSCSLCLRLGRAQEMCKDAICERTGDLIQACQPSSKVKALLGSLSAERAHQPDVKWYISLLPFGYPRRTAD